jgi:PTS system nitrogen regulatory IIA component
MKITDFLSRESIVLDLKAQSKEAAIKEMVNVLVKLKKINNPVEAIEMLMQREKLGSTGIGQGVAIPHSRCEFVKEQVAVLCFSKNGVEFEALDNNPVHILFLLLCPGASTGEHLQTMAKISKLLKGKQLRQALLDVKTADDAFALIQQADV